MIITFSIQNAFLFPAVFLFRDLSHLPSQAHTNDAYIFMYIDIICIYICMIYLHIYMYDLFACIYVWFICIYICMIYLHIYKYDLLAYIHKWFICIYLCVIYLHMCNTFAYSCRIHMLHIYIFIYVWFSWMHTMPLIIGLFCGKWPVAKEPLTRLWIRGCL